MADDSGTDKTARVLPASRQPVTPEHQASATGLTTGPGYDADPTDDGHEVGPPTGNPIFPSLSAVAAADADAPSRTATFEDAERFGGGTHEMHREGFGHGDTALDDTTTLAPLGREGGLDSDRSVDDGSIGGEGRHRVIDLDRGLETGVGAPLATASSSSATAGDSVSRPASAPSGQSGGASVLSPSAERTPAAGSGDPGEAPPVPPPAPPTAAAPASAPPPSAAVASGGRDERPRGGAATPPAPRSAEPRSAEDIERDIEATRQRLAGTIDAISDRVKPANVAARGKSSARALVIDERGQLRMERVRPAAGVVVALLVLTILRRRRRRRRSG